MERACPRVMKILQFQSYKKKYFCKNFKIKYQDLPDLIPNLAARACFFASTSELTDPPNLAARAAARSASVLGLSVEGLVSVSFFSVLVSSFDAADKMCD